MDTRPPTTRALSLGAMAAAVGSALYVEHRSREAERRHRARHDLVYIHGTRLHYRLVGEGPPVMLVHGNLVDGADFEASGLVERLARQYRVLVIDRPGFGHSDRPRGTSWTPAQQARLLHHAAAVLGVERPVVLGHSLGTQVALCMALQNPSGVAGLVLVSGYYFPSLRLDRWMAAPAAVPVLGDVIRYTTGAWTARATLRATVRSMFHPCPVPAHFFEAMPREMLLRPLQQRATAEDGFRMVKQARLLESHYGEIRMPVTLVAGARDRVVAPRQSLQMQGCLPQARLRMLAGVGHMAHYHSQEQIAMAIDEALTSGRPAVAPPGVARATPVGAQGPVPSTSARQASTEPAG